MNNQSLNSLSDDILETIRRRSSGRISLDHLSKKHKCEKSDIIFAIDLLRESGYEIDTDPKGRYRLISTPDRLLAAEIKHGLKTSRTGKTVYAYKSVQSTNSIAMQLAEARAPEGAIVVAESQTRGRGRLGRSWHSPEGTGIYLSIIIYPDIDPATAPGLSIMTGLALTEAISTLHPGTLHLKWPNDCLVNGRKVAGILTELSAERSHVHHVVVGIGINANHRRKDFPEDLKKSATSLRAELKKEINRVEFLQKFLYRFEKNYDRFLKSGLSGHRKKILQYSNLIGKRIRLDMSGNIISGKAVDIDGNGSLVLETPEGRQSFNAGEVTIAKGRRR